MIKDKKSTVLGQNISTASSRLKKLLLYKLLVDYAINICYRCNELIEDEAELSIDHKIAWLNSATPVELFYDLDNIGFSHFRCNARASTGPQENLSKTECPSGHPYNEDNTKLSKSGGRSCRVCARQSNKTYMSKNRALYKTKNKLKYNTDEYREWHKEYMRTKTGD